WNALPDLAAVGLLTAAFASVARRNQTHVSKIWLTGWLMIALHFAASLFSDAPGSWGVVAEIVGTIALIWAGVLFMWASVPYRIEVSSQWMLGSLLSANALYIGLIIARPANDWTLIPASVLLGAAPLAVALAWMRKTHPPLRWVLVALYGALAIFLLLFQMRPDIGTLVALNAVLFTAYLGCCIHFFFGYRRATAGAFVTIAGFFAWANVFTVGPFMVSYWPSIHIESEVWNLPKFVVALGMILLLLEDQIAHNQYLALHDHLTGLPNRRLYQDRLANALERARRSQTHTALLMIDLDGFKQINDTLGHNVGDLVLERVASLFASRVRRSDTVARTGGDEFSVILEDPTSREDAQRVGHSLTQLLSEPLELGEHTVRIGASVGIAMFPDDASEMEDLCIAADLRMYEAKQDSRELQAPETARANSALPCLEPHRPASLQVVE
ncbi:MAG: GGDEF domain-containing protein, partial [Terracidiphilus sp.]|nr:GGDEF domain-containing protein [Terracidiphilus sp.]